MYIRDMEALRPLAEYVEDVIGEAPRLRAAAPVLVARLPLFLRASYEFVEGRLLGHEFMLALRKEQAEHESPSQLDRHVQHIEKSTRRRTALVLPALASHDRRRLIRRGVPFIVPGRQMFLPMLMVDLRERSTGPRRYRSQSLSGAAQLVLLCHLHRRGVEGVSLREVASMLGYSAMTLSNVRHEIVTAGLGSVVRRGRSHHLRFNAHGEQLWAAAQPRLKSPAKTSHWVQWKARIPTAFTAGISALAARTMLDDDELMTYAMHHEDYRKASASGAIFECADPDDANATVQSWNYVPSVLATNDTVDDLSLYLSLRDTADERISQALADLLETFPW